MGLTARPCDINSAAGGLFKSFPLSSRAGIIGSVARSIGAGQLSLSPAALHSVVMGLFASTIAPFGGFLASGFKRAFKIKDFSSILPGHGASTRSDKRRSVRVCPRRANPPSYHAIFNQAVLRTDSTASYSWAPLRTCTCTTS